MNTVSIKVFVGTNEYAGGEFLFVSRTLEGAKQNMRERYATPYQDVVFEQDYVNMNLAVCLNGQVVARIVEETI
jgi:hypothetical protein